MRHKASAFTLLELLVVIGIMAMIGAIVAPSLKRMKSSDILGAANRQVLDGVAEARRLAIANRTTVYMVFMPPADPSKDRSSELTDEELTTVLAHQQTGYSLFAWRTAGDQPGRDYPQYLRPWRSLPEGIFIATWKFTPRGNNPAAVGNCLYSTNIPIPSVHGVRGVPVPYIAFNYLGQLVSDQQDEFIPLARGSIESQLDSNRKMIWQPAKAQEEPPNNSVDNYNHIHIDWLTGRASLERPEI